ncbi:MAG: hypothetical protein H7Z38_04605 [Rubrivivax sp.]|nr:hypothetical protein [Pyrinomonadaceae bacterium]
MKDKDTLVRRLPRALQSARASMRRAARCSSGIALSLMLLCQSLAFVSVSPADAHAQGKVRGTTAVPQRPAPAPVQDSPPTAPIYEAAEPRSAQPISTTVVNFEALSQQAARARRGTARVPKTNSGGVAVSQNFSMNVNEGSAPATGQSVVGPGDALVEPLAPSPARNHRGAENSGQRRAPC